MKESFGEKIKTENLSEKQSNNGLLHTSNATDLGVNFTEEWNDGFNDKEDKHNHCIKKEDSEERISYGAIFDDNSNSEICDKKIINEEKSEEEIRNTVIDSDNKINNVLHPKLNQEEDNLYISQILSSVELEKFRSNQKVIIENSNYI